MHGALRGGPDHCPPDLFSGDIAATVRGLKAHASTIAHSRYYALAATYPRTRTLLGDPQFDALAERHLTEREALRRRINWIGAGFADRLTGPPRDLAKVEWAWLDAYGASDADAIELASLASLDPAAVVAISVARHPAARLVPLRHPVCLDGIDIAPPFALVSRPDQEVHVNAASDPVGQLFTILDQPTALGALLEADAAAATFLITSGTLVRAPETPS